MLLKTVMRNLVPLARVKAMTMVAAAAAAGCVGTRRSSSMSLSWIAVVDGLWGVFWIL